MENEIDGELKYIHTVTKQHNERFEINWLSLYMVVKNKEGNKGSLSIQSGTVKVSIARCARLIGVSSIKIFNSLNDKCPNKKLLNSKLLYSNRYMPKTFCFGLFLYLIQQHLSASSIELIWQSEESCILQYSNAKSWWDRSIHNSKWNLSKTTLSIKEIPSTQLC